MTHEAIATALLDDALNALEAEDLNALPPAELADRVIAVADALYRLKVERLRGQGALLERQRRIAMARPRCESRLVS